MITSPNASYPKRAVLLALQPIGIGTPSVESMESYTLRLARAHDVSRKTLERFINSRTNRLYFSESDPPRLDSPTFAAKVFGARLAELTLCPEVTQLGLGRFAGHLSTAHTLKKTRAWCGHCFKDARTSQAPAHLPMLWSIASYQFCAVHKQELDSRCPHCGTQSSATNSWASPIDHCPVCRKDLALATAEQTHTTDRPDSRSSSTSMHESLAATLAEFVAQSSGTASPISQPDIGRLIHRAIESKLATSAGSLGAMAGVPKETLSCIRNGRNLPSLSVLLRLAATANVSIAGLFWPERWAERIFDGPRPDLKQAPRLSQRHKHDWTRILLESRLAIARGDTAPLVQLAKHFGVDQAQLSVEIGELREPIKAAASSARLAKRAQDYDRLLNEVRHAKQELYRLGQRVSLRAVGRHLNRRTGGPYFRKAYKELRHSD